MTEEKDRNQILYVYQYSREGGDVIVKCPHCDRWMGIEGDDDSEFKGEMYQDNVCNGWLEVHHSAQYVKIKDEE